MTQMVVFLKIRFWRPCTSYRP